MSKDVSVDSCQSVGSTAMGIDTLTGPSARLVGRAASCGGTAERGLKSHD